MGLLDLLLGKTNPVSQFVGNNANAIHGGFANFGRATNIGDGFAGFGQGAAAGGPADQVAQQSRDEEAARQAELKKKAAIVAKYSNWFAQRGDTQTAQGIADGIIDPAEAYYKAITPKAAEKPIAVNDQLVDPTSGKVIGDYRTPVTDKPKDAPNGYQWASDGSGLTFIPGGPADPSTAGKTTEATRRNQQLATVIDPELKSLIGDGVNPGTFDALANGWDMARANTPGAMAIGQGPSAEYQQAQNSLKTIVASYLYSVSGATANPGEVQNQVDVLTPKLNEDPKTTAAKKARLIQMVEAVKAAATGKPINIDNPGSAAGGVNVDDLLTKYGVQ